MKNWHTLEADVKKIMNKHFTKGRAGAKINKVIVHHNAGRLSIDQIWNVWQTRPASAHYQVDASGRIGQLVWDSDMAWHAKNLAANRTSIGIEHANSSTPTSPLTEETLENGAHLVAAVCVRFKLGRPVWGKNVFGHSDFASTACPGTIGKGRSQHAKYMRRAQYWYDQMTGAKPAPPKPKSNAKADLVRVTANALNYRSGPGTNYKVNGTIRDRGVYTITERKNGWGRLKSGAGWIHLGYTKSA